MCKTTTPWERMVDLNWDTAKYLRGTHRLWSRLRDGELIFIVLPEKQAPGKDDGGYMSIAAALTQKGLYHS